MGLLKTSEGLLKAFKRSFKGLLEAFQRPSRPFEGPLKAFSRPRPVKGLVKSKEFKRPFKRPVWAF
jgi:hypothetical protein